MAAFRYNHLSPRQCEPMLRRSMPINPYEPPREADAVQTYAVWNAGDYVALVLVPIFLALVLAAMLLPAVQ